MNLCTPRQPSKIPQTPAAILLEARSDVFGGGMGGDPPVGFNSGYVERNDQLPPDSSVTGVCLFTRPSVSHWRNCSALTGPYSFPSAPMILYMMRWG